MDNKLFEDLEQISTLVTIDMIEGYIMLTYFF